MYCPERSGHVQLTHCVAGDCANSWRLFVFFFAKETWAASLFENLFSGCLSLVSNVFKDDVDDTDGDYDDERRRCRRKKKRIKPDFAQFYIRSPFLWCLCGKWVQPLNVSILAEAFRAQGGTITPPTYTLTEHLTSLFHLKSSLKLKPHFHTYN